MTPLFRALAAFAVLALVASCDGDEGRLASGLTEQTCVAACQEIEMDCCAISQDICDAYRQSIGDCAAWCDGETAKYAAMGCGDEFAGTVECVLGVEDTCSGDASNCDAGLEVCKDVFCDEHPDASVCTGV